MNRPGSSVSTQELAGLGTEKRTLAGFVISTFTVDWSPFENSRRCFAPLMSRAIPALHLTSRTPHLVPCPFDAPQIIATQHQRPYGVFGLDDDIRHDVGSRSIEMVSRRQGEYSPQINTNGLRSCRKPVQGETCLKPTEPKGWGKQLERTKNVPQKGLTEAVIFCCAGTSRWTTETVRMMRRDDNLLSNGFDRWGEGCF